MLDHEDGYEKDDPFPSPARRAPSAGTAAAIAVGGAGVVLTALWALAEGLGSALTPDVAHAIGSVSGQPWVGPLLMAVGGVLGYVTKPAKRDTIP